MMYVMLMRGGASDAMFILSRESISLTGSVRESDGVVCVEWEIWWSCLC